MQIKVKYSMVLEGALAFESALSLNFGQVTWGVAPGWYVEAFQAGNESADCLRPERPQHISPGLSAQRATPGTNAINLLRPERAQQRAALIMTTTPPPRKRFPFFKVRWHLSTAIVMMFVAGALIWANINGRWIYIDDTPWPPIDAEANIISTDYYGWPMTAYERLRKDNVLMQLWQLGGATTRIDYFNALVNAVVAVLILTSSWFLCERLIRRRAAQKGS